MDAAAALLDRLLRWAAARPDVDAVLLTGSRARPAGPVDADSDLDVELYVDDVAAFAGEAWLEQLGEVLVCLALDDEDQQPATTRLVFFADGAKADLQIQPPAALEALASGLDALHERGYRVLLDRSGRAAALPPATHRAPRHPPPDAASFAAVCTEFWFEAAHIPRYLRRGELWVVQFRSWTMHEQLLRLLEWHALARGGPERDVWHIGTHLRDWAAPEVWERLHGAFGRFDADDSRRALAAVTALFAELSAEVADAFALPDPRPQARRVQAYLASPA